VEILLIEVLLRIFNNDRTNLLESGPGDPSLGTNSKATTEKVQKYISVDL
jgi:hypothetical protein